MAIGFRNILPALAVVVFGQAAGAAVVSGEVTGGQALLNGGAFVQLDGASTFTIGANNLNTPDLYAFDEVQDYTLTSDLTVGGVTLAAGTSVSSHYVAFDPFGYIRQQGYVMFDSVVLAVASTVSDLFVSDFLASPSVTYLGGLARGLEAGEDEFSTAGSRVDVNWRAWRPGDFLRVITAGAAPSSAASNTTRADIPAAVPLPAGGLLLIGALGGLAALRRRKRA